MYYSVDSLAKLRQNVGQLQGSNFKKTTNQNHVKFVLFGVFGVYMNSKWAWLGVSTCCKIPIVLLSSELKFGFVAIAFERHPGWLCEKI